MGNIAIKFCRHCGRVIPLASEDCPYCGENTVRGIAPTRSCPFCSEEIKTSAVKCKHCGEWLDGRTTAQAEQVAPTLVIEKAIIAQQSGGPGAEMKFFRPDGSPIDVTALPQADARGRTQLPGAEEAAKAIPGRAQLALPGDVSAQTQLQKRGEVIPVKAQPVDGSGRQLPARVAESAPPATVKKEKARAKRRRKERKAEQVPQAGRQRRPCPSCGRFIYEDDKFCENCGHDMSKPVAEPYKPGKEKRLLRLARYGLLLASGAPAFLACGLPLGAVAAAAAGVIVAIVSFKMIAASEGELSGQSLAVAACIFGAVWIVLGLACM